MPTKLPRRNPKTGPIIVSDDGLHYSNEIVSLQMQSGPVERFGVRSGLFPEELIQIAAHRLAATGEPADIGIARALEQLLETFAPIVPDAPPPQPQPSAAAAPKEPPKKG